jgi:hypothetical protein
MYYVKYRDFFGNLNILEGRSELEDAKSEAEDVAQTGGNGEVEVLVTVDVNTDGAAASSRRLPLPGRDDGTETEAKALR